MTPTNPPSVPSLDVEACVRLTEDLRAEAEQLRNEAARRQHEMSDVIFACFHARADRFDALASALPGMGKDAERWRVLTLRVNHIEFRNRFANGTYSLTRADESLESDRFIQSRIAKEIDNIIIAEGTPSAARAAQPEETNDAQL